MGAYPYPNNQLITRDMHDLLHSQDIIEIHYSEILELRDSHNPIPDTLYRIIDYQCTSSDPNTQCAGHNFDIIVLALTENTLSERARAIQNQNDSYFANSKLEAWQVWYCLDNDTSRFQWAHTDGTGVIYRLIDEFNNDCPYDFKNIMFKRSAQWFATKAGTTWANDVLGHFPSINQWYYTFSWVDENDNVFDLSIIGNDGTLKSDTESIYGCYDNKISLHNGGWEDIQSDKFLQILNNNVIVNLANYDGGLFYGCYSNTFGNGKTSTQSYCRYIIFQNGIQNVNFTCTQTTSSSKYCQNILLHSGLIGTYSAKLAVQINVTSITYSLEVGKTSAGTLKIWNPAD